MNKDERDKWRKQLLCVSDVPAVIGSAVISLLDHIDALERQIEAKDSAINDVLGYNVQEAIDRYGDARKAETWSCVIRLRAAIASAPEVHDAG